MAKTAPKLANAIIQGSTANTALWLSTSVTSGYIPVQAFNYSTGSVVTCATGSIAPVYLGVASGVTTSGYWTIK